MSKKQIKITNAACQQVDHKESPIVALCLNCKCTKSSTICAYCSLRGHYFCKSEKHELDDIPKMLMELRKLQTQTVLLQEKVNQQFKIFIAKIEQILLPIDKYLDKPDSTNLNEIGLYLRKFPEQQIMETIDSLKSEIKILMGENIIKIKQLDDNEQQTRGEELYQKKEYHEAIKCFEKQIAINNIKHESSLYLKGCSLAKLGEFNESNQCYEKILEINPENFLAKTCLNENIKAQMIQNQ